MNRVLYILLVLVASLLIVGVVTAQDETPTEPDTPPVVELPAALEGLLEWLYSVSYVPALAFGVPVFVTLVKVVLAPFKVEISGTRAVLLALALQVLGWGAFNIARHYGLETQFTDWYSRIVQILELLFPLVLSILGGHVVYEKSKAAGVDLTGYKGYRKPELGKVG